MILRPYYPSNVCLALASLTLVLGLGCTTTDYEPLIVKEKIKGLEDRIRQLESKIDTFEKEKLSASHDSRKSTPSPEMARLQLDTEARSLIDASIGLNSQGESKPGSESELSEIIELPEPLYSSAELIKLIEAKGGFIVRNEAESVVEVDLTDAQLGVDELSALPAFNDLQKLILNGANTPNTIYDVLSHLKKLKHLEFERCAPTPEDLAKLKLLPSLTYLQLFRADLSDEAIQVVSTFPALEQLRCGQTRIGDQALSHLQNLKSLRAIDLSDCNRVSDAGLAFLADLPNMNFIKIWGPQITDLGMDSIARMKNLRVLGLNDSAVTDAGIGKLSGLSPLTEIHLVRTAVSDDGIEVLSRLPNLVQMNLRDTKISDRGVAYLAQVPKLERLDLSETNSPGFSDASAEYFEQMKNLKQLNLWSTKTTDTILASIVKLENVTWLNLDNTKITDDGIGLLRQMPQLTWLHVGSTVITDREINVFMGLERLKYLNISHTKITENGFYDLDDELSQRKCQLIGP